MKYNKEIVNPSRIKINVESTADEVNVQLNSAIGKYKKNAQLPGFRKGKIPSNLLWKKFQDEIQDEAKNELVTGQLLEIIEKENFEPLSDYHIQADEIIKKDDNYNWSFYFDILPEIELPALENLETDQAKAVVDTKYIDLLMRRLLFLGAKVEPAEGTAPAVDGQVAIVDIDILENGEPLVQFALKNYSYDVGSEDFLPEVETLIKGTPVGNISEQEVDFPKDFPNPELAGTHRVIRVKVNSVKNVDFSHLMEHETGEERKDRLESLRKNLETYSLKQQEYANKNIASAQLLEQLLKQTDFVVPQRLVQIEYNELVSDLNSRMQEQGATLDSLGDKLDDSLNTIKKEAEKRGRNRALLLAYARREGFKVEDKEVEDAVISFATSHREDPQIALNRLRRNGMMGDLKLRLLADKTMDWIYNQAKINLVEQDNPVE